MPPAADPEGFDPFLPFPTLVATALEVCAGLDDAGGQRVLERAGLSDGLPVVVPTAERIEAMLERRNPLAPATSAPLPMGFVTPTWWDVAVCAVLAGCEAGALELVATALDAVSDPAFNLLGVQATTGAASPLLMVHGSWVDALGLHAGSGALGPAPARNVTAGRAVRLALQSVGMARVGEGDMATHGHPGKISWLVAERQTASPWTPFNEAVGLPAAAAALTVFAGVGNVEVVLPTTTPAALADRLAQVLCGLAAPRSVVLLPPDSAVVLDRHGWRRGELLDALEARGAGRPLVMVTGGPGVKATVVPGWGGPSEPITRSRPGS